MPQQLLPVDTVVSATTIPSCQRQTCPLEWGAESCCQLPLQSCLWFLCANSDESQGQGQLLIQTVKLAFSVTNNVIRLKPPSSVVSPLEQALTQHGLYLPWAALLPAGTLQAVVQVSGFPEWFAGVAGGLLCPLCWAAAEVAAGLLLWREVVNACGPLPGETDLVLTSCSGSHSVAVSSP